MPLFVHIFSSFNRAENSRAGCLSLPILRNVSGHFFEPASLKNRDSSAVGLALSGPAYGQLGLQEPDPDAFGAREVGALTLPTNSV